MADYGNERLTPACLGMLQDTSDYNIDGTCVVASGKRVFVGVAVCVVGVTEDGYKIIRNVESENDVPYGVAMWSQDTDGMEQIGQVYAYPFYDEFNMVPVVSHGRIWTLGYSVTTNPGQKVKFNVKGYVNNSGSVITNWAFTGGNIPYVANSTRLIGVQVLQGANVVVPVVLVSSATLSASAATPSPNNAPVTISASVLPANADNKTGKFTANAANVATINQTTGVLTPVGTVGNVVVTWTANDGSGVTAQYTHRFEAPPAP